MLRRTRSSRHTKRKAIKSEGGTHRQATVNQHPPVHHEERMSVCVVGRAYLNNFRVSLLALNTPLSLKTAYEEIVACPFGDFT